MEGLPATLPVVKKDKVKIWYNQINDSPKNSTIFLLVVAFIISVLLFGGFLLYQELSALGTVRTDKDMAEDLEKKAREEERNILEGQLNSQDKERRSDINQINNALQRHFDDKGYYPTILTNLAPKYLSLVPLDPETGREYYYVCSVDQMNFTLRATFSDGENYEISSQ